MNNLNNNSSSSPSADIKASELLGRLSNGEELVLLDVREPIEFHTHNIGGTNIPLGQLTAQLEELDWNQNQEIIVVCQAGVRSRTAQSILRQNGYQHVRNLTGGLLAVQKLKY